MVDCRPKLVILALFCLIAFVVSLTIYIVPFFPYISTTCIITADTRMEKTDEGCCYTVDVKLRLHSTGQPGQSNEVQAQAHICLREECNNDTKALLGAKNSQVPCEYRERDPGHVHLISRSQEGEKVISLSILRRLLLALTIIFSVLFLLVMIRIFETELIRICPPFILTAWMNILSIHLHRRSSSHSSVPPGHAPEDSVSPPPVIASRRRISMLIEGSKLSTSEAKALREDGWSCCICLEEKDEDEQLRPVTRLKCKHATHSECLRLWLETGRAACCLCNADVFSDTTKEPSLSSRASSASDGDGGLIGSLVVERTDRTPSSPGTSVFIDASQPYSDTVPSNDERDGDV